MNYSDAISRCIEFIEENIKSDLTPEVIASSSGYSVFHFLRVFNIKMRKFENAMKLMEERCRNNKEEVIVLARI